MDAHCNKQICELKARFAVPNNIRQIKIRESVNDLKKMDLSEQEIIIQIDKIENGLHCGITIESILHTTSL